MRSFIESRIYCESIFPLFHLLSLWAHSQHTRLHPASLSICCVSDRLHFAPTSNTNKAESNRAIQGKKSLTESSQPTSVRHGIRRDTPLRSQREGPRFRRSLQVLRPHRGLTYAAKPVSPLLHRICPVDAMSIRSGLRVTSYQFTSSVPKDFVDAFCHEDGEHCRSAWQRVIGFVVSRYRFLCGNSFLV